MSKDICSDTFQINGYVSKYYQLHLKNEYNHSKNENDKDAQIKLHNLL